MVDTVNDPFTRRMLESLTYPNPPAGIAAILINVGSTEPVIIHVDLHDGTDRTVHFEQSKVWFETPGKPEVSLVSPLDSLQPKVPTTPAEIVKADPECWGYIQSGKKIQAIKRARELTQYGLKEAKDLIDQIFLDEKIVVRY